MVVLAYLPFSSIANVGELLGESDLYEHFRELEEDGSIAGLDVAVSRRSTRRFVLARLGVAHVTKPFNYHGEVRAALPLTWQMTEEGVLKLLSRLPMIEALYDALVNFWTSGLAEPFELRGENTAPECQSYLWLGIPALTDIRWLTRGRLHVAVTWRFYRPDKGDRYITLPFFWSGLLPQEDFNDRSLRLGSPFVRSLRSPGDYLWQGLAPVVIAIGLDEFAAWRARWAYGADVDVASMDPDGSLVWSSEASDSEWTLEETRPAARVIGYPENAVQAQGVEVLNFGGIREYRLFCFIAQFRAATRANLAKAFRMSRKAVKDVMTILEGRVLVTEVEGHLYVTQGGLDMLAARDRIEVDRLVEVSYDDPTGEAAVRERRHDAAVAEVAAHFLAKGLAVVAGWRWAVSWGEGKDEGQLDPDLWVRIPGPGGRVGTWIAVEVEFSATARKRIEERKLRSYRLSLAERGISFPILVITGGKPAAKLFDEVAGKLTIFTTTISEFKSDVWEGPESVWRQRGQPVDLDDIARPGLAHLLQPTGRKIERDVPPVETWIEMHGREFIWEDPVTAGWQKWQWDGIRDGNPQKGNGSVAAPPAPTPTSQAAPPRSKPLATPAGVAPKQGASPVPAKSPGPQASPVKSVPAHIPGVVPWEWVRERRPVLSRINVALENAYAVAERRLQRDKEMSPLERLCLQRLMAIVTYGVALREQVDEGKLEVLVGLCLRLEDEHLEARRALGWFKFLMASESSLYPREAFKQLVKDYPAYGPGARKIFNVWQSAVDKVVREARKARTLDSAGGPDYPEGS